jgi:hypothetical protein
MAQVLLSRLHTSLIALEIDKGERRLGAERLGNVRDAVVTEQVLLEREGIHGGIDLTRSGSHRIHGEKTKTKL